MSDNSAIVLDILKRLFGSPKDEYQSQTQFAFNCRSAKCKKDVNKYNLNYNSRKNIFHCFKCHYSGFITKIVRDYGTVEDVNKIQILFPNTHLEIDRNKEKLLLDDSVTCELPEGYLPLTQEYSTKLYKTAMEYLRGRKITMEMIKKYEIGYTETGPRKFRIIIPSRNTNGDINYYEARSFLKKFKIPYFKPDSPNKKEVIFNVKNINFDLPVYLVEGVFDMMPLINAIPMLGKDLSPLLLQKLIQHQTRVILCLDEDAFKDTIILYEQLIALNLDVYFVEVKEDIAKYYERHGREKLIQLISNYRKIDFNYLFSMKLKEGKSKKKYDEKLLDEEMEKIKKQIEELKNQNNSNEF